MPPAFSVEFSSNWQKTTQLPIPETKIGTHFGYFQEKHFTVWKANTFLNGLYEIDKFDILIYQFDAPQF